MAVRTKQKRSLDESPLTKIVSLIIGSDLSIELPYKRITEEGIIVDKEDHFQCFLKVNTNDLFSMNDEDLERFISGLTTLSRIYTEPFKIFSTTYPTETREQQLFYQKKVKQYRQQLATQAMNDRQRSILEKKRFAAIENIQRLKWAEDHIQERAFFIVVYGKTENEVKERVRSMQRVGRRYFGLNTITKRKTLIAIIRRLTNMNTEL